MLVVSSFKLGYCRKDLVILLPLSPSNLFYYNLSQMLYSIVSISMDTTPMLALALAFPVINLS